MNEYMCKIWTRFTDHVFPIIIVAKDTKEAAKVFDKMQYRITVNGKEYPIESKEIDFIKVYKKLSIADFE